MQLIAYQMDGSSKIGELSERWLLSTTNAPLLHAGFSEGQPCCDVSDWCKYHRALSCTVPVIITRIV